MISAPTGESQNVTGRIMAMVVSGPMPGSTPMMVPITQPNRHRPIFCQVSAMPKPIAMLDRMSGMSERRRPERDHDAQRKHEDPDIGDHHDETQEQQRDDADVSLGKPRKHGADHERQDEPERAQKEREGKAGEGYECERTQSAALDSLAAHERCCREQRPDCDQERTNNARKIAGTHGIGAAGLKPSAEP